MNNHAEIAMGLPAHHSEARLTVFDCICGRYRTACTQAAGLSGAVSLQLHRHSAELAASARLHIITATCSGSLTALTLSDSMLKSQISNLYNGHMLARHGTQTVAIAPAQLVSQLVCLYGTTANLVSSVNGVNGFLKLCTM